MPNTEQWQTLKQKQMIAICSSWMHDCSICLGLYHLLL